MSVCVGMYGGVVVMSLVIYVLCMYRSRWEAELVYKSSPVVSLQADLLLFLLIFLISFFFTFCIFFLLPFFRPCFACLLAYLELAFFRSCAP